MKINYLLTCLFLFSSIAIYSQKINIKKEVVIPRTDYPDGFNVVWSEGFSETNNGLKIPFLLEENNDPIIIGYKYKCLSLDSIKENDIVLLFIPKLKFSSSVSGSQITDYDAYGERVFGVPELDGAWKEITISKKNRVKNNLILLTKDSCKLVDNSERDSISFIQINDYYVYVRPSLIIEPNIISLKNKDKNIRRKAAITLGSIGDIRAVNPLILALKDVDSDVRREAAAALRSIYDNRAVEPLIFALKDVNSDVRREAARALGRINNKKAFEPLIFALKDANNSVRKIAIWALGRINDSRAVNPLILALKDADSDVRKEAAIALGRIKDNKAIEPLIYTLKYNNSYEAVLQALTAINPGWRNTEVARNAVPLFIDSLKVEDGNTRKQTAMVLGEIKDIRAVDPLIFALQYKDSYATVKKALETIQPDWMHTEFARNAVPIYIKFLKDVNKNFKREAIKALEEIKDPRSMEAFISIIKDDDHVLDVEVVYAVGRIKDPQAVEPMITKLTGRFGVYGDELTAIAYALGEIRDPRALEPLISYLKKFNQYDKTEYQALTDAILKFRDPVSTKIFISKLDEGCMIAAKALGEIKDPQAVEPLISLMNGGQSPEAVIALGKIKDVRAFDPMLLLLKRKYIDNNVLGTVAESLGEYKDPRAVDPLISLLKDKYKDNYKDEDTYVRNSIINGLAKIGDPRAVKPLISLFELNKKYVNKSLVNAFAKMPDPREVELLVSVIKDNIYDWDIRQAAADAIVEIKNFRSIDLLIPILQDKDKLTCGLVSETLHKITAVDFGEDQESWQKWWNENKTKYMK